jgi:osmotically inducible protein OsmC
MPTSSARAVWEGGLRNGLGRYEAETGAFQGDYSFGSRFASAGGTNPEELIAAAHAACLSMALAANLEKEGRPATRVSTSAACTVEKVGEGFKITGMRLDVRGVVPGMDEATFAKAAEAAKNGCPVSGALQGNVKFELNARLEREGP